jgi:hypothetical protein
MRIAKRSDPLSAEVRSELAYVLLSSHLYDEAAYVCASIPPDCKCWPAPAKVITNECLGRARVGQGRLKEAIEVFTAGITPATPMGAPIRGYLGYAYGKSGNREAAERIAAAAPRPYHQALAFAGMGDRNRALVALEKMASQGPVRVGLAPAVRNSTRYAPTPRDRAASGGRASAMRETHSLRSCKRIGKKRPYPYGMGLRRVGLPYFFFTGSGESADSGSSKNSSSLPVEACVIPVM